MTLTNEDLLALSDMMDKKLKSELQPIKNDIRDIKLEQRRIDSIIENEIRSDIKFLAENYVPAAKQYEKESSKIEAIQDDIEIMKKVIQEHSQKLQNIS